MARHEARQHENTRILNIGMVLAADLPIAEPGGYYDE